MKLVLSALLLLLVCSCKKSHPAPPSTQIKTDSSLLTLPGVAGATDSFQIIYPGNWNIAVYPVTTAWITVNVTKGAGSTKVFITTQSTNNSLSPLTATLVVTGGPGAGYASVVVHQSVFHPTHFGAAFGGTGDDELHAVTAAADGGYVAVGFTTSVDGDVHTNHGQEDLWLVKTDAAGTLVWSKTFGGTGSEGGNAIVSQADGGFIVEGYTDSNDGDVSGNHGGRDVWVIKINSDGNIVWQKTYGGSGDETGYGLIKTSDGNYMIAAGAQSTDGQVTGNHAAGTSDAWLVKINEAGDVIWSKTFGGSAQEYAVSAVNSTDGGYVIAANSNASAAEGDVTPTHGIFDMWVFKIDSRGNILWQNMYGKSTMDLSSKIAYAPDGTYLVTGYTTAFNPDPNQINSIQDMLLVKVDELGNLVWQKTYGGNMYEYGSDVLALPSGGCIVAGYSDSNDGSVSDAHGWSDVWAIKIDDHGLVVWSRGFGGSYEDHGASIIAAGNGQFLLAGLTMSIDAQVTGAHGAVDGWLFQFTE